MTVSPARSRSQTARPTTQSGVGRHAVRIAETMPLVAIALIVALLAAFVWFADHREREEARDNLIRDALWVEQTLSFQIDAVHDAIDRLALDMTAGRIAETVVAARLRTLVSAHPEIGAIEWRDETGVRVAVPPDGLAAPDVEPAAVRGFGPPRRGAHGAVADLTVPLYERDVRVGRLTARFHLDRLLSLYVPWWISQNNQVALVDRDGAELAHKSAVTAAPEALRHTLGFDPPLPGAVLVLTARANRSNLMRNLIGAGVVGLAFVAVASLFALTRHYRRRLAAEERLDEATSLRRAMEDSLTVGMRARDLEERIIYVNPAFCRMVGRKAEDLVGHLPPQPYWLPELVAETLARHQALGEHEIAPLSFETKFRRSDGRVFDVLVYEAPLIDAAGVHRGWMGSIIDVTERKRAEERERLQAEKLTRTGRLISLGEMASTISHELNQPLAAIASYAAGCLTLVRAGRPPEDLVGALEKLDAQAQRAGRVIRRVHDFVRRREPILVAIDIAAVVESLAGFAALDARKQGVEIVLDLAERPLEVRADAVLMEQVLLNLVRNGVEAMAGIAPAARRLEITLRRVHGPEGEAVAIDVADAGRGISEEVAAKLFSPFFSTKPEGMGMGLSICRSIVELHRGRLEFAARPNGGTVFTVTLPSPTEGSEA